MKVFYVYTHTAIETNTVFYVGMGTNNKYKYYYRSKNKSKRSDEWKALIVTTAEQAVEEYKIELMKEINILLDESKSKRDTINDECINPYFARLDTLEEIIKLITKCQ